VATQTDTRENEGSVEDKSSYSLHPSIQESWRRHAQKKEQERTLPIELELPSGLRVMAIRASVRWLWRHQRIPNPLLVHVEEMIALIESADPDAVEKKMTAELEEDADKAFSKWLDILNACWIACVTEPSFTDDPSRDEATEPPYSVRDVEYFDKMYLYQWAQGVDQSIIDFFQQQAAALAGLADGEGIPLSATSPVRVDKFGRHVAGADGGSSGVPVGELRAVPNRRTRRKTEAQVKQKHRTGGKVHPGTD